MWRGMWSSGRRAGGRDYPERQRCVQADGARKRATRKYMNRGLEPPPSLIRHKTEEYDRRQAWLSFGAGSSTGRSSSLTPLTPVKREPEELLLLCTVKRELEAQPERRGGGVIGPEDFLPPAEADVFESAIIARSTREEEEGEQRRQREADLDAVLLERGLGKALEFDDNLEAWRRKAKAQDDLYIDLVSDDDD